jgi:hypothetical protein
MGFNRAIKEPHESPVGPAARAGWPAVDPGGSDGVYEMAIPGAVAS